MRGTKARHVRCIVQVLCACNLLPSVTPGKGSLDCGMIASSRFLLLSHTGAQLQVADMFELWHPCHQQRLKLLMCTCCESRDVEHLTL